MAQLTGNLTPDEIINCNRFWDSEVEEKDEDEAEEPQPPCYLVKNKGQIEVSNGFYWQWKGDYWKKLIPLF